MSLFNVEYLSGHTLVDHKCPGCGDIIKIPAMCDIKTLCDDCRKKEIYDRWEREELDEHTV